MDPVSPPPEVVAERTGHRVYDAILELADHAFLQGKATAAGNTDQAHAEHRAVLLALADLQDLIPALAAEANPGASPKWRSPSK